jgi:hypothetical protein
MSIRPFKSNKELMKFAQAFLSNRLETFNKDVAICLTPNADEQEAYFPALMICIAFADLMSGLYAGTIRDHGLKELRRYARKFMQAEYTSDRRRLDFLYEGLRHKIAHLAYPYPVFDKVTARSKTFKRQRRRRGLGMCMLVSRDLLLKSWIFLSRGICQKSPITRPGMSPTTA